MGIIGEYSQNHPLTGEIKFNGSYRNATRPWAILVLNGTNDMMLTKLRQTADA